MKVHDAGIGSKLFATGLLLLCMSTALPAIALQSNAGLFTPVTEEVNDANTIPPRTATDDASVNPGVGIMRFGISKKYTDRSFLDKSIISYRRALENMSPSDNQPAAFQLRYNLAYALNQRADATYDLHDSEEALQIANSALQNVDRRSQAAAWSDLQELRGECLTTQAAIENNHEKIRQSIIALQAAQSIDASRTSGRRWLLLQAKIAYLQFILSAQIVIVTACKKRCICFSHCRYNKEYP